MIKENAETEEPLSRKMFTFLEVSVLGELIHHWMGFTNLARHVQINMAINMFILFGVIEYTPTSDAGRSLINCWITIMCISKMIRHFYQTYGGLGLRFTYFPVDWFRMTSFYVVYSLEYLLSLLLVLLTIPAVKYNTELTIMVPYCETPVSLTLVYFAYMTCSIPYFIHTFNYLHKKRNK